MNDVYQFKFRGKQVIIVWYLLGSGFYVAGYALASAVDYLTGVL